jgi:hypothetical protein
VPVVAGVKYHGSERPEVVDWLIAQRAAELAAGITKFSFDSPLPVTPVAGLAFRLF